MFESLILPYAVGTEIAFVRPKADATEARDAVFDPIDLADSGTAQVADSTVTVTRQEDHFNRAEAVVVGQLTSVIERPRPLYVATNVMRGCPMFNLQGKLLGIGVVRMSKTQGQAVAVVPAAEVRKAMEQIPKPAAAPAAVK